MQNDIHISGDRHATLCGNYCTCTHPDLKFQDNKINLHAATCIECVELSKLRGKALVERLKRKQPTKE